jgi:hypothetical protein
MWNGKNSMEIAYRQKFCFTIFKPVGFGHCLAFGAMAIATGVIADSFKTAVAAYVYMASESCRSAVLDILHYFYM